MWRYYKHVVAFVPKSWEKEPERHICALRAKYCFRFALCSTVMKNLMSKFNPTSIELNMFFLLLCSVVTGLPTKKPLLWPFQKWVRGKQVGGGAYIPCEWKLTLNDHSTIEETVALIQGALKEIDEEGVMEVEACEDFLYIMFNLSLQILFILYKCQIHNMFSPCAGQKVNLKQGECHTLPHQSLCMSNKPTVYVMISNMFVSE